MVRESQELLLISPLQRAQLQSQLLMEESEPWDAPLAVVAAAVRAYLRRHAAGCCAAQLEAAASQMEAVAAVLFRLHQHQGRRSAVRLAAVVVAAVLGRQTTSHAFAVAPYPTDAGGSSPLLS